MTLHYSEDGKLAEKVIVHLILLPHAITIKRNHEKITIITCLLFTVTFLFCHDETMANTSYCTPYCATPGNQQPKQSWKEAPSLLIIFLYLFCIILSTKQGYT